AGGIHAGWAARHTGGDRPARRSTAPSGGHPVPRPRRLPARPRFGAGGRRARPPRTGRRPARSARAPSAAPPPHRDSSARSCAPLPPPDPADGPQPAVEREPDATQPRRDLLGGVTLPP